MGPDSSAIDEIRRFEEQYRRRPDSLVFARLADAYRKAGQPERALAVLKDGLARHPDYPSGHIVRARALRDLGRVEETLESFRRVLELDVGNLVAVRELAGLTDERGETAEARHWYERLVQVDPTNDEAQRRLAELESATDSGVESWSDALPDPDPPDDSADERRPEDEVVEAILNGEVPETVRAEDTWWYEEQPDREISDPAMDADLLTRTMADLYAEQGLNREAAQIYEELLRNAPEDRELLARLESVREREKTPSPPVPGDAGTVAREPAREIDAIEESLSSVPLGRPSGPPVIEELRRILRLGEERAAALPDSEQPRSDRERARSDQESEAGAAATEASAADVPLHELGGFARAWLLRLGEGDA